MPGGSLQCVLIKGVDTAYCQSLPLCPVDDTDEQVRQGFLTTLG